jgi:hypothetical protein
MLAGPPNSVCMNGLPWAADMDFMFATMLALP